MDREVMTVMDDLKESVIREIRMINKKDSLSVNELKAATDALCLLMKIKEYEGGGEDEWSGMRSPVTGRYISRGGRYSGHSINDRMIAKLEEMYDEAKTEHEREEVRREIERLRNQPM